MSGPLLYQETMQQPCHGRSHSPVHVWHDEAGYVFGAENGFCIAQYLWYNLGNSDLVSMIWT
jgi:hypothetical protein